MSSLWKSFLKSFAYVKVAVPQYNHIMLHQYKPCMEKVQIQKYYEQNVLKLLKLLFMQNIQCDNMIGVLLLVEVEVI